MKETRRQLVLLPMVRQAETALALPFATRIGTVALRQVDIKCTISLHRGVTLSYSLKFITTGSFAHIRITLTISISHLRDKFIIE